MNNANQKQPEKTSLGAALEESLRRPAAQPRPSVEPEQETTQTSTTRPRSQENKGRGAVIKQRVDLEIFTGDSTTILSCKIPTELQGRVKIEAVRRQMSKFDGPRHINEIVEQALVEWYEKHVAA